MGIPTRTLSDFKGRLVGGGARPNLFEVEMGLSPIALRRIGLNNTNESFNDTDFRFLCKAASLPASTIANIDVPFRGRTFKVAGDRTIEAWTITVINDESFNAYRTFQNWMQQIGQYGDASGTVNPADYMGNAKVFQLGRKFSKTESNQSNSASGDAPVVAEYRFVDIWPSTVSNIDLSYDSSDTIEEFTVDFQVQYWYPVGTGGSNQSSDTI
tara:strand:- start:66 stop:704 length:639 start_codon:yes stop_codon:yes gene_type:complete